MNTKKPFIKRDLLDQLIDHLEEPQISLIVGPRQAGKTTLMKKMEQHLAKQDRETLFLDVDQNPEIFENQQDFLQFLDIETTSSYPVVFIDEIQRKKNAGLFLKAIHDRNLPYKFVVSGSGSLELKEKVHESLVGRKKLFELSTITFKEFVNYQTDYQYEKELEKYFKVKTQEARIFLEEYLNFGGYPRVVTAESKQKKREEIKEIYNSYLQKDISVFLQVRKLDTFSDLLGMLSDRIGGTIKYSSLTDSLEISKDTLMNYLYYAENTFIINRISPFFTNKKKEIVKSPKVYFNDIGLRNYSLDLFGDLKRPETLSKVFENLVFNVLKRKASFSPYSLRYWRTQSQAEVDFILSPDRKRTTPVEVKFKELTKPKTSRSLRSFINKYEPECAYIVNLNLSKTKKINDTKVKFISFFELLSEDLKQGL